MASDGIVIDTLISGATCAISHQDLLSNIFSTSLCLPVVLVIKKKKKKRRHPQRVECPLLFLLDWQRHHSSCAADLTVGDVQPDFSPNWAQNNSVKTNCLNWDQKGKYILLNAILKHSVIFIKKQQQQQKNGCVFKSAASLCHVCKWRLFG